MSDANENDVEIIDVKEVDTLDRTGLAVSSAEKPAAKKMKQLRLPFAPIQKNVEKASTAEEDGSAKKRKHSEEMLEPNKKPALDDSEIEIVETEMSGSKKIEKGNAEVDKTPKNGSKKKFI